MTLSEVMHVHIPNLYPESSFRDAVDKMDIYQFPALIIIDSDRVPLGVITEGDLVRAITTKGDVTGLGSSRALDFSSRSPVCAEQKMEISDALHLMINSGLTVLPVTHEGRLSGMVLRVDLMQALLMDVASPLGDG